MRELGRYPLLTAAEEVELAKRIERGDRQAKERMINSNLRLVIYLARRYHGHGLPLEDLIQEGTIGLTRAVEKFDWRKGFKFSTYATWWIRQACQRAVSNQSRTIRVPIHVDERRRKLVRARHAFQAREGREPTLSELAEETEIDSNHIELALAAAEASVSLNKQVGDGTAELGDLYPDPRTVREAEAPEDGPKEIAIREALERLPEPQRAIIELRFGLTEGPCTQEEVGRLLGLNPKAVRRLEHDALGKLERVLADTANTEVDELTHAA